MNDTFTRPTCNRIGHGAFPVVSQCVWLNSIGTGYLECMQCLAGPTASRDGYFPSSMRFLRAFRICTPTHVIHIYQARPLVVTAPTYTEIQNYDKQYKLISAARAWCQCSVKVFRLHRTAVCCILKKDDNKKEYIPSECCGHF